MKLKYEIYGRAKHYYSIYKKMKFQKKQIDEIFDLIAIHLPTPKALNHSE